MRVLALDVASFGALSGTRHELDEQVVIVLGPNEAGKSSFHAALETVLYGFDPASRAQHPYAQWLPESEPLELVARVRFEPPGAPASVLRLERRLDSLPRLRVAPDGEPFQGPRPRHNGPLAGLEAVPRKLFRAVYSLTANDTRFHEDDVRRHVEELLLGPRALAGVRPAHAVLSALTEDRRRLWKRGRTGNHAAKRLRAELEEAKRAVWRAKREARELEALAEEREALVEDERARRERREALRGELDDLAFLAQLAELRARADRARPLRRAGLEEGEVPSDPGELEREIARLDGLLAPARARLAAPEPPPDLGRRTWLARAAEVRALRGERVLHEREAAEEVTWAERATHGTSRAREACRALGVEPEEAAGLARRLDAAARAWRERRARGARRGRAWLWAGLAGGVALATAGLAELAPRAFAWPAAALLLAGVVWRARRAGLPAEVRDLPPEARGAGARRVDPARLEERAGALRRAGQELEEARRAAARALELAAARARRLEGWRDLARELGWREAAGADPAALPEQLSDALEEARVREDEARAEREERARAQAILDTHGPLRAALAARLERARTALAATFPELAGATDGSAAAAAWREVEAEHQYLRQRERDLARDERWARLARDRRLELSPAERAAEGRAELEQLDQRLAGLAARGGELAARLAGQDGDRVARAAEEVRRLEDELHAVGRRHDRLALLEALVQEAERRHRAAHQPDVLRRASEYLESITAGRYGALSYPEGRETCLHVESAERGQAVPVGPPLSRGTREQVYLCLRLGTLDHLDQGRERLPLLLDEALVHWDALRRAALYPLLARVATERQVVLFTCHPTFAEEARGALGAGCVELRPAGASGPDPAAARRAGGE